MSEPMFELAGTKLGAVAGMAAGVVVTAALRLSRKWDAPILDGGEPVARISGAVRIGEHSIRQRHREVVGPRIQAHAQQLSPGIVRSLVEGFGQGATRAPGTVYRLEVKLDDYLRARGLRHAQRG